MNKSLQTFTRQAGTKTVSLTCIPELHTQADFLLELLIEENKKSEIFKDNLRIGIGWCVYTIKETGDGYALQAPNFNSNPFTETTPDVSAALMVQAQINAILQKSGVKAQAVSFQDTLVILKDALEAKDVYMQRNAVDDKGDSGWYLGLLEDKKDDRPVEDYEAIRVYELVKLRPSLLQVLCLPDGCIAVFEGDELIEAVDEANRKIV